MSTSPPPRKWLVRRRLKPCDDDRASPKKTVVVARRIRPGQTLKLESGGTVTMVDDENLIECVPDTFVSQTSSNRRKKDKEDSDEKAGSVSGSQLNLYHRHMNEIAEAKNTELTEQRERLDKLLCGEMLLATREGRILERWEKMNQVWDKTRRRLSKRVGVSMERLSMDQGNEYREKIEAMHLLNTAAPLESKMTSPAAWKMSLRGETSTFVPIGNIFSGLFCEIKNSPPSMIETIRKPTRIRDQHKDRVAGSNWRNSLVYRQRFHQLRNRIAAVRPHDIVHTDSLEIVGQDLFDLRRRLPGYSTDRESLRVKAEDEQSRRDAIKTNEQNDEGQDQSPPLIVRLEISTSILTFDVSSAQTEATSRVTVTNSGTTAVHFRFRLLPRPDPLSHIVHDDHGFSWLDVEYTILPEQRIPVTFRFVPQRPGLSLLSLSLDMFPKPTHSMPPNVHLKGVKYVARKLLDENVKSFVDRLNADALRAYMRSFVVELAESSVQSRLKLQAEMRSFIVEFIGSRIWSTCQLQAQLRSYIRDLVENRVWPKCELRAQMRSYVADLVENRIPYPMTEQEDITTDKL